MMMTRLKRTFGLLVVLSLLGSILFVPAQTVKAATTFPVIDLRNYLGSKGGGSDILDNGTCSLRQAIKAINIHSSYGACQADATTTTILLPDQKITLTVKNNADGSNESLTGDLDISANMSIMGTGLNSAVGWDLYTDPNLPRSEDRVFDIEGAYKVNLSGFRIFNGTTSGDGGGILNNGGDLTLTRMTLDNNYSDNTIYTRVGGGVASYGAGSKLSMSIDNIINNYSRFRGGGVYTESITQIENSYFANNTALDSGAGLDYNNSTFTAAGVVNNTTLADNGGDAISNSGSLILSYLTVVGNVGYGVKVNALSWTYLRDSILDSNDSTSPGHDCFMNGGTFVDGGYNTVNPTPSTDGRACLFNNGDANTYKTQFVDPAFDLMNIGPQGGNSTTVYPFTQSSPVYNYHPENASGVCVSPAIPSGLNPYSIAVPNLPGYDQYLGPRPTSSDTDPTKGCDVGAYELGAYATKPHIYLPSLRKFN